MSILSNWFVKIALGLAIVAILAYDGIAIAVAHVGGQDDANNAAYAAAQSWHATHNEDAVFQAAQAAIPASDTLVSCVATNADATDWSCTLRRPARTVVLSHISFLRSDTVATETGSGSWTP